MVVPIIFLRSASSAFREKKKNAGRTEAAMHAGGEVYMQR